MGLAYYETVARETSKNDPCLNLCCVEYLIR